ncbi:MAG: group II intron reverse transcriptase/maturase [Acidobacteriaceae bacterium]|nr:group II intron reverse transcriptase/maturase [Acidobacteriaceae bacterium]
MSKRTEKDGVGQLAFTFGLRSPKDEAQETQENGPCVSPTPSGVESKSERKRKWHSLIDKVYLPRNLQAAWERVQENAGAAGRDGITVQQFARHAERNLTQLHADLREKTYRPQPVRRVYIPKSGGGKRPLGIPCVRDRIVQQALLQVLAPIFEATFLSRSHGFRPGKGCHTALEVVDRAIRHGYSHVVDADIRAFFDTMDHDILLDQINEEVADGSVLRLIRQILTAGVVEPGAAEVEPTSLGAPQGGPLSPLLANVYLHRLDLALVHAHYGLVRYADDFVIFAKSEDEAHQALALARQVLEGELGLLLHPEKTHVVSVDEGFEFLGFHYFRDPKTGMRCQEVRRKSVLSFRQAIRERTPRLKAQKPVKPRALSLSRLSSNERLRERIRRVNGFLRGWHGYFKTMRSRYGPSAWNSLDGFVRGRLRASLTGRVGRGWWDVALPNAVFDQLGLVSLAALDTQYTSGQRTTPARKGKLDGEPYAGNPHVRFGREGEQVTLP